jgi:hypothetical protein
LLRTERVLEAESKIFKAEIDLNAPTEIQKIRLFALVLPYQRLVENIAQDLGIFLIYNQIYARIPRESCVVENCGFLYCVVIPELRAHFSNFFSAISESFNFFLAWSCRLKLLKVQNLSAKV